ncbi:dihydroneopterin aldolase [filamentous cyanobacterium CCP5]|nr:dihydroneopterin aldolase [filamentous cyanobacterium CCP5]
MDTILLTGIQSYGYTGALAEENILGQWFEADLTLWLDLTAATQSDHLSDTHDYRYIIQETQRLIREERFKLIERLAGAIATQALQSDRRLSQVKVKLTKLSPPIENFSGQISIEIIRHQTDS